MLFTLVYSFFLAGSFQFSSSITLPSTHFFFCLPCYFRLSIFNWVSNIIDLILYVNFWALVADFSNTGARAPTSAGRAPFLPARRAMRFGHLCAWIMLIFRWMCLILIHRRHPKRWVKVVPRLNYLNLAVESFTSTMLLTRASELITKWYLMSSFGFHGIILGF